MSSAVLRVLDPALVERLLILAGNSASVRAVQVFVGRVVIVVAALALAACSASDSSEVVNDTESHSAPNNEPVTETVDITSADSPVVCTPTYINVPMFDQAILRPDNIAEALIGPDGATVVIAEVLEQSTTVAGIDELANNASQRDRATLDRARTIAYRTVEPILGPDLGTTFSGFVFVDNDALSFTACGDRPPEPGTLELISAVPYEIAGTTIPLVRWRLGLDDGRFNSWVPLNDWNPDRLAEVHELRTAPVIERLRDASTHD